MDFHCKFRVFTAKTVGETKMFAKNTNKKNRHIDTF